MVTSSGVISAINVSVTEQPLPPATGNRHVGRLLGGGGNDGDDDDVCFIF